MSLPSSKILLMTLTHQLISGESRKVASNGVRDGSAEDAETASEALVPAQSNTIVATNNSLVYSEAPSKTQRVLIYTIKYSCAFFTHCHNKRVERRALCDKLKGTKTMVAVQKWTSPGCQQGESDADSQSCDKQSRSA